MLQTAVDPAQTTHYSFDALGRPTAETITLAGLQKPGASAVAFTTATTYDATTGLVKTRTLADGRVLRTQRTDAAHGATVSSLTLQSASMAWLQDKIEQMAPTSVAQSWVNALPGEPIASHIVIDPFDGLTAYTAGNGISTQKQFDLAGRLTQLNTERVSSLRYTYGVGPRIKTIEGQVQDKSLLRNASLSANVSSSFSYEGFGRLKAEPDAEQNVPPALTVPAAPAIKITTSANTTASPVEVAQRDPLGRTVADGRFRYTYTPAGQIETVTTTATTAQSQVVATYAYNSQQQRVRKTLADGSTTYYLWQQGKLVAEINGCSANIDTQYLYFSEGQHTTPIAKLEQSGATHSTSATLFIHSDHHSTPVAMTDHHQRIVWQANLTPWGLVKTNDGDAQKATQQATLNIRLPGQYFDAETGLHDNWHRTYNPRTGRYLQPDPLGYHDGPNPYLYAQGDPINKTDPTGLYQIDMHYYMTFFLGLAAGLDPTVARNIALAAQYIDDNPLTSPVDETNEFMTVISPLSNQTRLKYYHFMQDTLTVGTGIHDVASGNQLYNLNNAYLNATKCAKASFFGETLHALADTFSHADNTDTPFTGENLAELGVGHGLDDSDPDYTFNHWGYPAVYNRTIAALFDLQPNEGKLWATHWNTNADRTLSAEQAMFAQLTAIPQETWAHTGRADILGLTQTLVEFNQTGESEQYSFQWDKTTDGAAQPTQQATLNIRLPGQHFDAETGLHDNWHRTYNPRTGRYLQPDPLGYHDGPNPYLYAQGDPINKTDPTGLYESDIHYYMTFFLAITAGIDAETARTIALAAQYVDDNPLTQPINTNETGDPDYIKSIFTNQKRVKYYHFALTDSTTGKTLEAYKNSNYKNPTSEQLSNLLDAVNKSPTANAACQFFGEFLHAFEDTFSHRDSNDIPIDAVWNVPGNDTQLGIGHGFYLHGPDRTYNHISLLTPSPGHFNWDTNEARTLQMEKEVYSKLNALGKSKKIDFALLESVLMQFNAIEEDDSNTGNYGADSKSGKKISDSKKITLLDKTLRDLGYENIGLLDANKFGYLDSDGKENREKNICDKNGNRLDEEAYKGTILPTTLCP